MSEQKQEQAAPQQPKQQAQQSKPQKKQPKQGGKKKRGLEVRGPVRGRWRAGRRFGPEPVIIALDELSDEERAAIEGDPMLSVREVDVEA